LKVTPLSVSVIRRLLAMATRWVCSGRDRRAPPPVLGKVAAITEEAREADIVRRRELLQEQAAEQS
jgi:hypothetical protein